MQLELIYTLGWSLTPLDFNKEGIASLGTLVVVLKLVLNTMLFLISIVRTLPTERNCPIVHFLDSDENGDKIRGNWLVIEASVQEVGGRYRFVAEDNGSAGVLWLWQDDTLVSTSWSAATDEERRTIGYWLNDDGTDFGGTPRPFRWL